MGRRQILFSCEGNQLLGTLDEGSRASALLIVTGGNETRAGAWNGQSRFAADIASRGYPVFRFDRRGTGDSEGSNGEFRSSGPDIAAAIRALRETCPQVSRVVAFGNCDGAAALMLARGHGCDALILSNPWTIEDGSDGKLVPEAVRDHYRRRLTNPAALRRLITGKVSAKGLVRSLFALLQPSPPDKGLSEELAEGIAAFKGTIRFLVAERDRTGLTFLARWNTSDPRIRRCPDATHSYVEPSAQEWLCDQVVDVLNEKGA